MKVEERQQWAAVEAAFYASEPEVMARLRSEYDADPQGFVLLHLGIGYNQAPYPTFGKGMPQSMQESKWAFRVAEQGVRELFAERERMIAELTALRNVQQPSVAAAPPAVPIIVPDDRDRGLLHKALHEYVVTAEKLLKKGLAKGEGLSAWYADVDADRRRSDELRSGLMTGVYEARLAAADATSPQGAFVVIQEGGASAERYIHSSDSAEAAEEFRASCEAASYRTSAPIAVPGALAAHGDALYELLETVVTAELDYPEDDQEWKP